LQKNNINPKERREFIPIKNTIINTSLVNYCNIQGLRITLLLKKKKN
jgi:hypothetical protein